MKAIFAIMLSVVIGVVVINAMSPSYQNARNLDLCQLALDREYPAARPLVRQAEPIQTRGSSVLYLVEFQFGSENDKPHVAHVIYKDKDHTQVVFVQ
jgi:hypothetical protein